MQATPDEISALLKLQQIDLALLKARKQFEELPQRDAIRLAREKRAEVRKKQEQVDAMRRTCEAEVSKLEDEDASLSVKQRQVQALIDEAKGDYRNVEARTKELDGIAKRRGALEEQLSQKGEELSKIEAVAEQVSKALAVLDERERAATGEFQQQGGALKAAIAQLEAKRGEAAAGLGPQLGAAYEKTAKQRGGVAVGVLTEGRCGTCRMPIESGRLVELKRDAPLGVCPHCKRLLVIA